MVLLSVGVAVGFAGVVECEDVRVRQAPVLDVRGEIHRRHATAPEFALDGVARGDGRPEAVHEISHRD